MTAKQLKSIRKWMKLDVKSMAAILDWRYRTYQDRELGNRSIPEEAAQQVREAYWRDAEWFVTMDDRIDAYIAENGGIEGCNDFS
jgi:hypothetical protein